MISAQIIVRIDGKWLAVPREDYTTAREDYSRAYDVTEAMEFWMEMMAGKKNAQLFKQIVKDADVQRKGKN